MAKFSVTNQIPCRYGLDELPADITRRELLYFFSFNPTERQFVREKGRFPSHQIVLGIHLAAYRFIGRPQYYPENTPSIIIQHVADSLKLDGEATPLIYSDRERTRRDHIKGIRELSLNEIDLDGIPPSHVRYLAQQGVRLNALRLKTYTPSRIYAIVVVTLAELESDLIDVVIQMNDEILAGIYQRAQTRADEYYKKHRRMVTRVIHAFRLMSNIHLDEDLSPLEKIAKIDESLPPEKLRAIRDETDIIDVPRGSEKLYFASRSYQTLEKYLPKLLETIQIIDSSKSDPILEAADYYLKRRLEGKGGIGQDAPTGFVQEARWKRIVFDPNGRLKTKSWVLFPRKRFSMRCRAP
jgi:hypothetical protein